MIKNGRILTCEEMKALWAEEDAKSGKVKLSPIRASEKRSCALDVGCRDNEADLRELRREHIRCGAAFMLGARSAVLKHNWLDNPKDNTYTATITPPLVSPYHRLVVAAAAPLLEAYRNNPCDLATAFLDQGMALLEATDCTADLEQIGSLFEIPTLDQSAILDIAQKLQPIIEYMERDMTELYFACMQASAVFEGDTETEIQPSEFGEALPLLAAGETSTE